MEFRPLPAAAGWRHRGVRVGYEVCFFGLRASEHRLRGHTTARESDGLWSVGYDVTIDAAWRTVAVHATAVTSDRADSMSLTCDRVGRWDLDGEPQPWLDGCLDVDFESSGVTNTLPIHRLDFVPKVSVDVPAAFVRADGLRVERLEQTYTFLGVDGDRLRFDYESVTFDFACRLEYDLAGLIIDYPGIAVRDS